MHDPTIRTVDPAEEARATSVQTMAFSADPVMRWLWPEPHAYLTHFPTFVRGFSGAAFGLGAAHMTDDYLGGALWLPPGVGSDDALLESLMHESLREPRRSQFFSMLEQVTASHPEEPHWHLCFLGVDPRHQGRGLGAALLRHALAAIDAQGVHAYLESSNAANVPLYQRHGFEIVREVRSGDSPTAYPMIRPARR